LSDAIAIAKRAGAGKLVIGDYLTQGRRIAVSAKLFNVRTGQRILTAAETATTIDEIAPAYRSLAHKLMNVQLPAGAELNGLGTQSVEAIREYTLGLAAYNRNRLDSARGHFTRAVTLDSTFALARARLGGAANYEAALRHSGRLPERERIRIALTDPGLYASASRRARLCDLGNRLLAIDSTDADGWHAMGHCHGDDLTVTSIGPEQWRRERSYNFALTAWMRALASHPLRDGMIDVHALRRPTLRGCIGGTCVPAQRVWGALVLESDTLVARLERVNRFDTPDRRREFASGRRSKLLKVRDVLLGWMARHPEDLLAGRQLAHVLLDLGQLTDAQGALDAIPEYRSLRGDGRRLYEEARATVAWKTLDAARAAAILDSTEASPLKWAFARFGAPASDDGAIVREDAAKAALRTAFNAAYAGAIDRDFQSTLDRYIEAASDSQRFLLTEVGPTLAFHTLRTRAAADTAHVFPLFRFQAHLARGDTGSARRALAEYDQWGAKGADDFWDGHEMFSAESYLELGDTVTAWNRIEPLGRRWAGYVFFKAYMWGSGYADPEGFTGSVPLFGRTWLLYADLAMATGRTAEARRGYAMIVAMWEKGDAVVQPLVQRARDSLARLGGS
jgi:hypothetical protein